MRSGHKLCFIRFHSHFCCKVMLCTCKFTCVHDMGHITVVWKYISQFPITQFIMDMMMINVIRSPLLIYIYSCWPYNAYGVLGDTDLYNPRMNVGG